MIYSTSNEQFVTINKKALDKNSTNIQVKQALLAKKMQSLQNTLPKSISENVYTKKIKEQELADMQGRDDVINIEKLYSVQTVKENLE